MTPSGWRLDKANKDDGAYLAEEFWVILHLGQGVKDVGEEHHGEALLFLGRGAWCIRRSAVVLAAPLVVKCQQLYESERERGREICVSVLKTEED